MKMFRKFDGVASEAVLKAMQLQAWYLNAFMIAMTLADDDADLMTDLLLQVNYFKQRFQLNLLSETRLVQQRCRVGTDLYTFGIDLGRHIKSRPPRDRACYGLPCTQNCWSLISGSRNGVPTKKNLCQPE